MWAKDKAKARYMHRWKAHQRSRRIRRRIARTETAATAIVEQETDGCFEHVREGKHERAYFMPSTVMRQLQHKRR